MKSKCKYKNDKRCKLRHTKDVINYEEEKH